jgi:hypothetical protein
VSIGAISGFRGLISTEFYALPSLTIEAVRKLTESSVTSPYLMAPVIYIRQRTGQAVEAVGIIVAGAG